MPWLIYLLWSCFTTLQHFSGHFEHGQLTYLHCSWASLLGSLALLSAHSFTSNWQLPFLNQRKGENGRRNYFMINLHKRMLPDMRIEPVSMADMHPIELLLPAHSYNKYLYIKQRLSFISKFGWGCLDIDRLNTLSRLPFLITCWLHRFLKHICGTSSEFVSSSIPPWQILTAHAQPFRGARDLAFCLIPLDSLLVWASSGGSGETAQMRLAWTFAARLNLHCSHRR